MVSNLCKSRIVAVFDNAQKLEVCDGQQDESIQSGKQTLELDSSGASEKKSTLGAWILQLATVTLKQTFFNFLGSNKKEQYCMHF
jgi:hypothetical protein